MSTTPSYQGSNDIEQPKVEAPRNLLNGDFPQHPSLLLEDADRESPEIRIREVKHSFWRTALWAGAASGLSIAALALVPGDSLSPWVDAGVKFVSGVLAGALSIRINDALVERSQTSLDIIEDVEDVRFYRRFRRILRRNHERTLARGTEASQREVDDR